MRFPRYIPYLRNLRNMMGKFDIFYFIKMFFINFLYSFRIGKISKKKISIDLGHEIFLGPEAFFNPEIIDKDHKTSLDELTFSTIEQCPIDYKRMLYSVRKLLILK